MYDVERPEGLFSTTNLKWMGKKLDLCPSESDAFFVCTLLFSQAPGYAKIKQHPRCRLYSTNAMRDPPKVAAILGAKNYRCANAKISVGTFRTAKNGDERNLLCVNAICLDIDYKNSLSPDIRHMDVKSAYRQFYSEYFENGVLPHPTFIEYSYNFQVVYVLDASFFIPKSGKKREKVFTFLERLMSTMKGKIDPKWNVDREAKIAPYIRIPESYNVKWSNKKDLWGNWLPPERYDVVQIDRSLPCLGVISNIQTLTAEILPPLPTWYEPWRTKKEHKRKDSKPKINHLKEALSQRMSDLRTLQKSGYGDIDDWKFMTYLYRLSALQTGFTDAGALDAALKFNEGFSTRLSQNSVINYCAPLDKNWRFTNSTIRKKLGLAENQYPELFRSPETRKDRYQREKKQKIDSGDCVPKSQQLEEIYEKILQLKDEGFKQKEIAAELGIPLRTIKYHYATMRERKMMT